MLRSALALLLLAATVASAEVPDDWKKIRSVLREFDYEVEKKDDWLQATHDDYLNMFAKGYKDGILLQAYFKTSDMDVSERDIRKLNNKLSLNATTARFYIDGDGDLMCETWYPGKWDKELFKIFLEAWHDDTSSVGAMLGAVVD
jgi:hypothetical protein